MPRAPKTLLDETRKVLRQPFLVRNRRAYYDDGRFISERPQLVMAPNDVEGLRNYMANHGFARPVYPSDIDVAPYYGPYLPGTERLMREPGMSRHHYIDRYAPQDYSNLDGSCAFTPEDYQLLKEMRQKMEAKRRTREEYLDNIEWYQD